MSGFDRLWKEDLYPRIAPNVSSIVQLPNISWAGLTENGDLRVASFELRKLNHGYSKDCPRVLYIIFKSVADMRSFGIDYEITAGNIPHRIGGSLHVVVRSS